MTTCSEPPGTVSQSWTTATRGKRLRSPSSAGALAVESAACTGARLHATAPEIMAPMPEPAPQSKLAPAPGSARLRGCDIVCVGFADWDSELWTNQHHLMSRLAAENRVL